MVRKSLKVYNGIKGKMVVAERLSNPRKHYGTIESQERIDNCLNCTRPANECKGNCYGKDN